MSELYMPPPTMARGGLLGSFQICFAQKNEEVLPEIDEEVKKGE